MAAHAMVVRAGGTPGSQDHSEVGEAAREAPSCCCENPCPRRHLLPWHLEPGTEAGARATGRGRGLAGSGPTAPLASFPPEAVGHRAWDTPQPVLGTVSLSLCGTAGAGRPPAPVGEVWAEGVRGVGVEGTDTPGVGPSSRQVCVVWVFTGACQLPVL